MLTCIQVAKALASHAKGPSDKDITQLLFIFHVLSYSEDLVFCFSFICSRCFSFIYVPLWAFSTTSVISQKSSFVKPI